MKRVLLGLLLLLATLAGAQLTSQAVAPTYRLKTGLFVNSHASPMGVPQLAALGVVGVRIDAAGTLTANQINTLVANYTSHGWSAADSILWTIDHYDGTARNGAIAEAVNAWGAGVRNFEIGNEPFNSWWSGLSPPTRPYDWARYHDFVQEVRAALGPTATLYGGCLQEESAGSGFTSLGIPWAGSTFAQQSDWIARTPEINVATAHLYAYTAAQQSGELATLAALCGKPCICSEVSTTTMTANAARDYFQGLKALTGVTVVYYDGPDSDVRGLFSFDAGTGLYDTPTATATGIASLQGITIPPGQR